MSLGTSKTILKIFGIFDVIVGIIMIALAVLGSIGVSQTSGDEQTTGAIGVAILFALALVSLLEGIFSIRGAKDASKIMPAWIFAIIGVITGITGLFTGGNAGGSIGSLIINIVIFIAANNIKKSRNAD